VAGQYNDGQSSQLKTKILGIVPTKIKHGALWVVPAWMTFTDVILSLFAIGMAGFLVSVEFWRTDKVSAQSPLRIRQ
jgi:hypothetical protein